MKIFGATKMFFALHARLKSSRFQKDWLKRGENSTFNIYDDDN